MFWIFIAPSILIGWSLGSNNFASVFPSVANRVVNYKTAIIVGTIFIVLDSWIGGVVSVSQAISFESLIAYRSHGII